MPTANFEYIFNTMSSFKNLHIPKMVVPTGLSADGRPTAVQFWGRALSYEEMFDDAASARHDADFLHLMKKLAEAMHAADPSLQREDAKKNSLGFERRGGKTGVILGEERT